MVGAAATDGAPAAAGWRPWVHAILVVLLVLAGEQTLESFERHSQIEHERAHAISELAQVRARLEGVIHGNLLAIHGVTAIIAAQPDMGQEQFARIARGLVTERRPLRNVAGAPNMVISLMYPLEGNEAAIGLDYTTHPTQRDAALRAIESRQAVTAGPLELVQGGKALIVRAPVFLPPTAPGGPERTWGLVSAVLDIATLYELAELPLTGTHNGISLAIRGTDGRGALGDVFFGDPQLFERSPATTEVSLPGGNWQLAALPAGGWGSLAHDHGLLWTRIGGAALALVLALLTFLLTRSYQGLRQTTLRLSESQALFQGFMDHLPAGAFIRRPSNGDILFQNRWLRETLDGHTADCGGEPVPNPDDLKAAPQVLHHQAQDRHGAPIHCDTLRFLLPETSGAPLIGGVIMDVTARTVAEQDLAHNRALLRSLLDTIPDLVFMKDPQGVYLACNPRVAAAFGVDEAQIPGRTDRDFVGAEQTAAFRANDRAAIAAGRPICNEEQVAFASDGHVEVLETIKAPVYDHSGGLLGVVGIARDITARKQAEEQLQQQRQLLADSQRIARIGSWEIDIPSGTLSWSDEAYRIYGVTPDNFDHSFEGFLALLLPDDRQAMRDWFDELLALRAPGDLEFRIQRPDGGQRVISGRGTLDLDTAGKPLRAWGTAQDITERKQAEAEARQRELVLDSVFTALPDLLFLMDADGTIRDYRAGENSDLYVPPEVFLGRPMRDVLPADVGTSFVSTFNKALTQGGIHTIEYALDMPGAVRHYEARLTRLPGSPLVLAVVRDISERVVADALLEQQRQMLAESQRIAHIGSWEYDLASGELTWSDETYAIYGVDRATFHLDAQTFLALVHPEDRPAMQAIDRRIRSQGEAVNYDFRIVRPNGESRHLSGRAVAVSGPDGSTRGLRGTVQDVTAQKVTEKALEDREQRLRLAIEAADQGLYDLDMRTGEAIVSPEYARMLGYSPDEFHETNAAWLDRLHPDDRERVTRVYQDYVAGRLPEYRVEFRQRTKDGGWRWILSLGKIQERDADGQPLRMLGTHTDITPLKEAEAALADRNQRLIEAEAQAHMGHWWLDGLAGKGWWADEIYRILGAAPEKSAGPKTLQRFVHPQDWHAVEESIGSALAGRSEHDMEYRVVRPGGEVRRVRCRARLVNDQATGKRSLWGTFQDITEVREAQIALEKARDELEERVRQRTAELETANKELETFTYSVSHDLKAPLRGIDGYSRLLLEDYRDRLDDEGRTFLDNVRRGVEQMEQLIEDLLSYSRMERRNMQGAAIDLQQIVDGVIRERRDQIDARQVTVEVDLEASTALADPDGLSAVLRNLVDNALKFTRDSHSPFIRISTRAGEDAVLLTVEDNGIGFDMRFHDRIFDIFQRLQRAEDYPGTGIGLAIVRKAMQRMGGRVWAESAPGQGAKFNLELPT